MASSMVKETRDASIKDDGTCSNGRSGKNKYSGSKESGAGTENGVAKKGPLCNGDRSGKELLCL